MERKKWVEEKCYKCAHVIEPEEEPSFIPLREVNGTTIFGYLCETCSAAFSQVLDDFNKQIDK